MKEPRGLRDEVEDRTKGRLAEVIVEQMFQAAGYMILRYGYESIAQNLVQGSDWHTISKDLEVVESAPDFIVKESNRFLYFLEVKYRTRFDKKELEEKLKKTEKHWKRTFVIVVTPEEPVFRMMYQDNGGWKMVDLEKFRRANKIPKTLIEIFKPIVKRAYYGYTSNQKP